MPRWDGFFANLTGALIDLMIQMFATFLIAAGAVAILRRPADGPLLSLLFLAGGLGLLAVLTTRVVRGTYVMGVRGFGSVDLGVSTVSVPYFVVDLGWLVFGAFWLHASLTDPPAPPDPYFDLGGPATVLSVEAVLLGLRIRSRLRDR
ncbi:hypothetical protein KZZ52_44695 [Dactylosporangium sp. AC04546]|uniref:hypothetical protein n=1 Tax=Dactylosporangium sp. AC04546 TaxID=2862460 RepID=UPI001EDF9BD2|nr:hypothetical protein [Dactylosporangium sp. AC04546]WVK81015.1 hypothetical protein KZZ52_44695 [Dactylosporangium sp. AC04546]